MISLVDAWIFVFSLVVTILFLEVVFPGTAVT